MSTQVDARDLSCPQPVLMTIDAIKAEEKGEIEVLVDTETSKENVSRAAENKGWIVANVAEDGGVFKITITKA